MSDRTTTTSVRTRRPRSARAVRDLTGLVPTVGISRKKLEQWVGMVHEKVAEAEGGRIRWPDNPREEIVRTQASSEVASLYWLGLIDDAERTALSVRIFGYDPLKKVEPGAGWSRGWRPRWVIRFGRWLAGYGGGM